MAGEIEYGALTEAHRVECDECVKDLLRGIPPEGGHVNYETLEKLVRCAFMGGVVSASQEPDGDS